MYSINNIFPNVNFADGYLSDGAVVRVQFTLGYGSAISGRESGDWRSFQFGRDQQNIN